MNKTLKLFVVLVALAAFFTAGEATAYEYMDGKLNINGFLQTQYRLHVAGANPNNEKNTCDPNDKNDTNMWRSMAQFEINYEATPLWNWYAKVRAVTEQARQDKEVRKFEAHPKSYPGDFKMEDDDNMLELAEFYTDITCGNFWLRLGKQQVAWGQTDGFRLLDIVNPLDMSWRLIADAMYEGHDNVRESLWMVRLNYSMPMLPVVDNGMLELIYIPQKHVWDELPAVGSPYNVVPAVLDIHHERQDGNEWGAKFSGLYKRLEFSLNYFRAYSDYGVAIVTGPPRPDDGWGAPFFAPGGPPFNCNDYGRLKTTGKHPLMNHIGWSASYDENDITKAVYRVEFLWEPDRPYEGGGNAKVSRIPTMKYMLGIDRPTWIRWLNARRTVSFGFQFFQTLTINADSSELRRRVITLDGGQCQSTTTLMTFAVDTQYKQDRIHPIIFYAYDTRGGYWFAPQCEFLWGDNWRFYVMGTFFGGSAKDTPGNNAIAPLYWWDDVMFRVTYQF